MRDAPAEKIDKKLKEKWRLKHVQLGKMQRMLKQANDFMAKEERRFFSGNSKII